MKVGRSRHRWGVELSGFGRPFGLGFDAVGRLHVTDMDTHVLTRFDHEFQSFQWHDGESDWSAPCIVVEGQVAPMAQRTRAGWNGPHSVTFDGGGDLYVTCYHEAAIHVLSPAGKPLRTIGQNVLSGPASAFFDRAGRLLVAEYSRNAVLALEVSGAFAGCLGRDARGNPVRFEDIREPLPATNELGGFDRPHMVRQLADDTLAVADTWNNRVQRFSPSGEFLGLLGDDPIPCPVALDPGPDNRLLVTAWSSNSVLTFEANDARLPRRLDRPRLKRPYDARFWGDDIVVADSHNSRVLIIATPAGRRLPE